MVSIVSQAKTILIDPVGFRGFNPMTKGQADKFKLAYAGTQYENLTPQVAKFVKTSPIKKTDKDMGNGNPLEYDAIKTETDYIYAVDANISALASKLGEMKVNVQVDSQTRENIELITGTVEAA